MKRAMIVFLLVSIMAAFLAIQGPQAFGATVVEKENFTIEYELVSQSRVESTLFRNGSEQCYLHTTYMAYSLRGKVHNSLARNIATLALDFKVQGKPQQVIIQNLGPYENQNFEQKLWEVPAGQYLTAQNAPSGPRLNSSFPSTPVPETPPVILNSFTFTNKQGESKTARP